MTFRDASRILGKQVTVDDIGDALGLSAHTIRQAKLTRGSAGWRAPPQNWERAIARLARARAQELTRLAEKLESLD